MADDTVKTFKPLGAYDWPNTPVNRNLDRLKNLLKKRVFRKNKNDEIDLERLAPVESGLLDKIAAPPANKPLMEELDSSLKDWLAQEHPESFLKTLIFPPCDREDFLRSWAESRNFPILEVLDFERTMSSNPEKISKMFNQEVLVIPRLEDWFRRSETHLSSLRLLLSALDNIEKKVILGCNSWAWQFLRKSCEIDSICVDPITYQAFDAVRLGHWLENLSEKLYDGSLIFKSAKTGDNAFNFGSDSTSHIDYMSDLANKSLGIPWVAWNIWRASLRRMSEQTPAGTEKNPKANISNTDAAAQTLWISELKDFTLPDRHDQRALLVLQTLLIHNGLSREHIELTIPISQYSNVLPALVKSGMVDKVGDLYHCVPTAYPAIRNGLRSAGFPMDVL